MKSLITYFVLTFTLIVFSFVYYPKFQQGGSEATISWDVSGYYWYLPSFFIYKDLKHLNFSDSLRNKTNCTPDNQQITVLPNGIKVLKYSSGMALQYLPTFLVAHALAKPLGYEANGFSKPYQLSIHIGALLMMCFGLWYLRKLLLQYYKDATVAWVLFFLLIGTNYLNYAIIDVGMTHAWLFAWYCILMYASNEFYKQPKLKWAAAIGLVLGIQMLTRPTEAIAVFIPLLWGISRLNLVIIKDRIQFVGKHIQLYMVAACCTMLIGSIQIVYWKYSSGHWFVYSYGDQEFTWLHPHWFDYIWSYRCGWLIYCPLMILPYIGFIVLYKNKINAMPLLLFALCYLWIVAAWDIWWYGGRAMIQGYAVLMFPFASLIEYVNQKKWLQLLFYPVAGLFVYLNIWWVHGCHLGGYIYASDMSEAYYKKIVGKFYINEQDRKLLDVSEDFTGVKQQNELILNTNFVTDSSATQLDHGLPCYFISDFKELNLTYSLEPKKITKNWIRVTAHLHCIKLNWDPQRMTVLGIRFFNKEKDIKMNRMLIDRLFYKNDEQDLYLDCKVPQEAFDKVDVFISNTKDTRAQFLLKGLKVEVFD